MTKHISETDDWRQDNVGRLLNKAVRRFESRILQLMCEAGHHETRISHIHLTRNLDRSGTRASDLAKRAAMTKQAMGELIDQCVSLGLIERRPDPRDGRARIVKFTRTGMSWLEAFRRALDQAEAEMKAEIGERQHKVLRQALLLYGSATAEVSE